MITTAEKYRQLEASSLVQVAKYIFDVYLKNEKKVLLGDYLEEIKTGKTPSKQEKRYYEDNYIDWFKPDEIGTKYLNEAKEKLSKYAVESNQVTIYKPKTILINAIGDVGRISILNIEASSNQQITGIKTNESILRTEFLYYYLLSNRYLFYQDLFQTTLPIINQKKILQFLIIVPDIKTQDKFIDFFHALESIDNMEEIENITITKEIKDITKKFYSIDKNKTQISTELTHQLDLVKQLRQAFLREAMQGRLVSQDPADGSAADLLRQIKAEKQKLIAAKKLKKEKELPPIKSEEIPFDIPDNWVWCRLGGIVSVLGDGLHGTPEYSKMGEYYFVNGNNLINGKIEIKDNTKKVSIDEYNKYKKEMNSNTVLVSINGTLGNLAFFNNEKIILGKSACYFNLFYCINKYFIGRLIKSSYFIKYAVDVASETTIKNVSLKSMRHLPIPLPPLSEQQRIVEKLDELMGLCDELEQSIRQSREQADMLLRQVLREALQGPVVV